MNVYVNEWVGLSFPILNNDVFHGNEILFWISTNFFCTQMMLWLYKRGNLLHFFKMDTTKVNNAMFMRNKTRENQFVYWFENKLIFYWCSIPKCIMMIF